MKQRLPGRITDLLGVAVSPKDGLPGYICRKCKRKLERLEKAAEELDIFRSEARTTHNLCSVFREIVRQPTRCKAREIDLSIIYVIKTKKIGQIERSREL